MVVDYPKSSQTILNIPRSCEIARDCARLRSRFEKNIFVINGLHFVYIVFNSDSENGHHISPISCL